MSYSTFEISNQDGLPVHFYEFWWGETSWFYTSADRDLEIDGQIYTAVPIMDEGITIGGGNPAEFRIKLADNLPVVSLFRGTPPSENVRVVVLRKHLDDPEATVFFAGKIDNVKRDGQGGASLFCSIGKLRRGGLRLTWSRTCPHALYDSLCRVSKDDFGHVAIVSAVTGIGFTVSEAPSRSGAPQSAPGYFDGGIVAWDANGLGTIEQRAIERGLSATEFLIFGRADGLTVGQEIVMYPGCDRLATTCQSKFNNLVNYGGIPQMPGESPYGRNLF